MRERARASRPAPEPAELKEVVDWAMIAVWGSLLVLGLLFWGGVVAGVRYLLHSVVS